MKNHYNKIATKFFITVFAIFFLANYATGKDADQTTKAKIQKEILVAKDAGEGTPFHTIGWCGNKGLLIESDKFGIEWIGINRDNIKLATKRIEYITGCTPDGKWVLYEENGSSRVYKDKWGKSLEELIGMDGPGWHGHIFDIHRFEIATGKQQKLAVVRDDSSGLVSPDGTMILLGNKHDSDLYIAELEWKKLWLSNEWVYGSTRWLADSSGIATMIWDNGHSLGIEIFDKENSWSKEYDFEALGFGPKPNRSIHFNTVDKDNRLYFTAVEGGEDYRSKKFHFFRCEIKGHKIGCNLTGRFSENGTYINTHELLPSGDFIFSRDDDNCIRRLKGGQSSTECIAGLDYSGDTYKKITLIGASPNGRHIAFRRGKKPPKQGDRFYSYRYDLFVKELSGE